MKRTVLLLSLLCSFCCWSRTDVYTNYQYGVQIVSEYQAHDNLDYGIPSTNVDRIIDRDGYAIGFSNQHHQPLWAAYRLTAEEVRTSTIKRTDDFRPDKLLMASATPQDYKKSGYDKGHLVPAADLSYSSWTMHNSFLMSNMSPQAGELNRESWRLLEEWVRSTALRERSISVITGPIISTNATQTTIGTTCVTVPDAYYKVILDETSPCKIIAFVLENGRVSNEVKSHVVSVKDLERRLNVCFFVKFPKIRQLKDQQNDDAWMW